MNRFMMLIAGFTLMLSACSNNAPVAQNQAGTLNKATVVTVKEGVVTSVKDVAILGRKSNAIRTVGSVTGSILGASGTVAGSLIGSMIGGAIGSQADQELSKQKGLEITLQLVGGEKVIVTQLAKTKFKAGDRVQLITEDSKARVIHLQDNS